MSRRTVSNPGSTRPDSTRAMADWVVPARSASSRWVRPARLRASLIKSAPMLPMRSSIAETLCAAAHLHEVVGTAIAYDVSRAIEGFLVSRPCPIVEITRERGRQRDEAQRRAAVDVDR